MRPTFYQLLGVAENATPEELSKAWKARMKQYHPDVNPAADPKISQEFNRVYSILSDPETRAQYDAHLAAQRRPRMNVTIQVNGQTISGSPSATITWNGCVMPLWFTGN